MTDLVKIAHFSDLHLGPIPAPRLSQLMNKRIFGYVNWYRRRRSNGGMAMLERLVNDAAAQAPDVTVLTGDMVNIALPQEFDAARDWLSARFDPARTMAVLGNHDAYVPGATDTARTAFAPYLTGETDHALPVRIVGDAALIGVASAVPRPLHLSSGRVGYDERARLKAVLHGLGECFKIVLIHYPPDRRLASGRRGLDDCDEVSEVLAEGGADLVLHGHNHRPSLTSLKTSAGSAPVVGVESASSDGSRHPPAAYNLYSIDPASRTVLMEKRTATDDGVVGTEPLAI